MSSSDSTRAPAPVSGGRPLLRLALRLVVFCLPLAAVWGGLEAGMRKVSNSYSLKRDGIKAVASEVDTLILGASAAYYAVCPREMSGSAFNLANVSQSLYYDDQLLTRLAPDLPKLKRVLLGVNYISLTYEMHNSGSPSRQYYYQHAWNIPPALEKDRLDLRMWSLAALYPPAACLSAARQGFKTNLVPEMDARGWFQAAPHSNPPDLSNEAAAQTVARHESEAHRENEAANTAYLVHFLSLCRERHLEAVLFIPPVSPAYAQGLNVESWLKSDAVFERLTAQYGGRYLSFLRGPGFEPADFYDIDHLNSAGAVRFTRMLDAALRTMGPGGDQGVK